MPCKGKKLSIGYVIKCISTYEYKCEGLSMRLLGIGDNVIDQYLQQQIMYPGGNALNFAVYAKMLGNESGYIGIFGNDGIGDYIKSVLKKLEIDFSRSFTLEGENGFAQVHLVNGDRKFIGSNKGGVSKEANLRIESLDRNYVTKFDIVCSSINSHMDDLLLDIHKDFDMPLAYDFSEKGTPLIFEKMSPSLMFGIISCGNITIEEMKKQSYFLLNKGCKNVIATRGLEGSYFFDGKQEFYYPAHIVAAIDTLGAGDSYLTGFITTYIEWFNKRPYQEVIEMAMKTGATFSAKNCMIDGAFGYGIPIHAKT